jgi:aspartyl-tRNA(Asn)/glutamyl-tRNA(Gln) amidotransferase subunit B
MVIKGQTGNWNIVVGIEVHAQINTKKKLFSSSAATHDAMPNTQV